MTLSTVDVIWSALEAKHPHVSLTPLAAFFSLAALHHDAPLGYHTPPPLPPMVHHCRVPQQFAHAAVTAFCVAHTDVEAIRNDEPEAVPVEGLHVYTELAHAINVDACGMGVLLLRKLLAVEAEPPAVAVVQTGVVPRLIEIANDASMPTGFVFQSLWALTSVLSSDDPVCKALIPEVLPTFVMHAATTNSSDVGEQVAWGIGNAADGSIAVRDYVLQLDSVPALLSLVDRVSNLQLMRHAVWAMSNLCRGKPAPALELVQPLIPKLHLLLQHSDSEVVADAAWAMSYISDGPEERIRAILPAVEDIVALLALPETSVTLPAVRTVGNIVTGTDQVTQLALDAGCLPHFHFLLAHPRRGVRKEACWALSNITAGSSHQIQQVIDAGLIPPLLNIVQHGVDDDVVKEAVWAINNSTCGGLPEQLLFLVDNGVFLALTSRLQQTTDVKLIVVLLEAVENLLSTLNDTPDPDCRRQFQDCGGVALLHTFSNSHVVEISRVANALLETYFDEGEGTVQQDADEHAGQRSSHAAFQF